MNLQGLTTMACGEAVLKHAGKPLIPEMIYASIDIYNGKKCKLSALERRMRESDNVRSVKVPGKVYVRYEWVGD